MTLTKEKFYWPKLEREVIRHIHRCQICHIAKSRNQNIGLYKPLLVSKAQWENVSIGFFLGFPKTQRQKDSIMVIVGRFSKISHFIPYHKTNNASHIADLYFKEVVCLHGIGCASA